MVEVEVLHRVDTFGLSFAVSELNSRVRYNGDKHASSCRECVVFWHDCVGVKMPVSILFEPGTSSHVMLVMSEHVPRCTSYLPLRA